MEEIGHNLYVTREVQREKRTYSLKVHTCKFITDVLEYMPEEFYVDYIVFLLKPEMGNCLTEVKQKNLFAMLKIVTYQFVFFFLPPGFK